MRRASTNVPWDAEEAATGNGRRALLWRRPTTARRPDSDDRAMLAVLLLWWGGEIECISELWWPGPRLLLEWRASVSSQSMAHMMCVGSGRSRRRAKQVVRPAPDSIK